MRSETTQVSKTLFGCGLAALLTLLAAGLPTARAWAAELEDIQGPDVTIVEEEDRTVMEYRQNGYLRMIRVIPKIGKPYYLVPRDPTTGIEDLERADTLLPSWVIVEF